MSGRDLEFFMDNAEDFSALSDEDKARLFAGEALEGETSDAEDAESADSTDKASEESSETPAAAESESTEKQPEATPHQTTEAEQVIMAKDGSHTIPFSVLEAERQRVRDLEQQLQAAQQPAPVKQTEQETGEAPATDPNAELKALFAERDDAFYSGDTEKTAKLNMRISYIQQELATQAAIERIDARNAEQAAKSAEQQMQLQASANSEAVGKKYSFLDFQSEKANHEAIDLVVAQRDRLVSQGVPFAEAILQAAEKVAPLFVQRTTTTAPEAKTDAASRAAEVIAKAKTQVPTSLSSVPAGASAHHDEGEAIRNRSGLSLLSTFEGKSADDILKLMSRVI